MARADKYKDKYEIRNHVMHLTGDYRADAVLPDIYEGVKSGVITQVYYDMAGRSQDVILEDVHALNVMFRKTRDLAQPVVIGPIPKDWDDKSKEALANVASTTPDSFFAYCLRHEKAVRGASPIAADDANPRSAHRLPAATRALENALVALSDYQDSQPPESLGLNGIVVLKQGTAEEHDDPKGEKILTAMRKARTNLINMTGASRASEIERQVMERIESGTLLRSKTAME